MTRRYETQAEAHKAVIEHYQGRNAGRGQYPARIIPKRELTAINPDGSVLYSYTYKGEAMSMIWTCYGTTVEAL
jgi:hypothetical protein